MWYSTENTGEAAQEFPSGGFAKKNEERNAKGN